MSGPRALKATPDWLAWDRVDLERGLIEIRGEVKNEYRNRVIPVCRRVVEALNRPVGQRDVKLFAAFAQIRAKAYG